MPDDPFLVEARKRGIVPPAVTEDPFVVEAKRRGIIAEPARAGAPLPSPSVVDPAGARSADALPTQRPYVAPTDAAGRYFAGFRGPGAPQEARRELTSDPHTGPEMRARSRHRRYGDMPETRYEFGRSDQPTRAKPKRPLADRLVESVDISAPARRENEKADTKRDPVRVGLETFGSTLAVPFSAADALLGGDPQGQPGPLGTVVAPVMDLLGRGGRGAVRHVGGDTVGQERGAAFAQNVIPAAAPFLRRGGKAAPALTGEAARVARMAETGVNADVGNAGARLRANLQPETVDAPQARVGAAERGLTPPRSRPPVMLSAQRRGSESGSVDLRAVTDTARAAEGWIEGAEAQINKGTGAVGRGIKRVAPGVVDTLESARSALLDSPEKRISPEFADVVEKGRATQRGMEYDADVAVRAFRDATKGLTPEQVNEVGRSLSSEASDLSTLNPKTRAAVEKTRGAIQQLRAHEVETGTLSPEAFSEYPEGHLKRVLKEPKGPIESLFGRRGGVKVKPYETAADMPQVRIRLGADEARALVPEGAPLRYLKAEGGETLVKFTNGAAGVAARDAFLNNVKAKFAGARADLGAKATAEIRAGDVGQAKMLAKAQLDTPRFADLRAQSIDAIPEDVAARIFVNDPVARAHVTMTESARRIGKAETLRDISTLVDEKGAVAIEPQDAAAAARGMEKAPVDAAGRPYELLAGKQFGKLAGKFVREDVATYVKGAYAPEALSLRQGITNGIMERFKVARLLYSPRQWFRQVASNMEFENLMGFSNWAPRYAYWKTKGFRAMREGSPYYRDLVANRFLDPAFVSAQELGLAEQALSGRGAIGQRIGRAIGSVGATEVIPGTLRKVEGGLGRAFSFADSWTKSSGYVYAREHLGMSAAEAAAYVRKWTPSPEAVSDVVKSYSRSLAGDPWARFKAEANLRIPIEAAKEKPIRLAMNVAQRNLIRAAAVAAGASALSDDEETAIENEQGSGAVTLGRNEKGEPLSVDYTFLSTMGDFIDTPSEVGKKGDHLFQRGMDVTGLGNNPMYGALAEQVTGRDRYGRPINPEGTVTGRAASMGSSFLKGWVPSLATNHRKKLQAAWEGRPFAQGQPVQTKEQAVLDVFFGFKLTPLDASRALRKIQQQGARALDDIESVVRREKIAGETPDIPRAKELARLLKAEFEERAAPLKRIRADLEAQPLEGVR